ncbi:MAG: DMT family transporter [Candidatus Hodarchaeota archaeon]
MELPNKKVDSKNIKHCLSEIHFEIKTPNGGPSLKYRFNLTLIMKNPDNNNLDFNHSQRNAQGVLLVSNIIWGITPIFLEIVLKYLTPLQTTTLRFGVGVLALTFFLLLFKRRNGFSMLSVKTVILLGWLDAFGYLTVTIGLDMTTPGLSTLLSSFYIFLVPFIAWKLEENKLNWRIGIISLLSLTGVFLINFNGDWRNFINSSNFGILYLMFSSVLWGFYTVLTGKFLDITKNEEKKVDLINFTYASLFHTFLALTMLSMITGELTFSLPPEIIPYIVFTGLFPTLIALGLWNWAIARLGSISTSFFQLLQVIIPFLLEIVFFHQFYSGWIYTGIILILLSTFWINDSNKTEEPVYSTQVFVTPSTEPLISNTKNIANEPSIQCCY